MNMPNPGPSYEGDCAFYMEDDYVPPTPDDDEEIPGIVSFKDHTQINQGPYRHSPKQGNPKSFTEKLGVKDSSALKLTAGCLILVVVIWSVELIFARTTQMSTSLFDLLKYIVTSSLGFFLGTANRKD